MTPDETIEDRERYQDDIDKVLSWFNTLSYPKQDNVVERLDETVHELYGNLASAVNNVGIEAQLKFIFEQCGDQAWDWLDSNITKRTCQEKSF